MNTESDEDTIERLNHAFSRVTYLREPTHFTGLDCAAHARHRKAWTVVIGTTAAAALTAGGMVAARRITEPLPAAVAYATDVRSPQQAAELADGEVTIDEYKAAFQRFSDCMERDGRPLDDVSFNGTTELYSSSNDGVDDCYDKEFYAVDLVWQLSDERARDPLSNDPSMDEMRAACATDDLSIMRGRTQEFFDFICPTLEAASSTSPTTAP